MRHQSLEEAMAGVEFPVYGLPETEDVCGLRYSWDPYAPTTTGTVTLTYQSQRYLPFLHEKTNGPTFLIRSCLLESEPGNLRTRLSFGSWSLRDIPEAPRPVQIGLNVSIEGKSFKGYAAYTSKPVYFATFSLSRGRMMLEGESLGPSIEELIQILESLHDLNGKEIESSR